VAAPVQRTPGRRPLPVAVDTHRATAESAADTNRPDTDLLDTDRGSGSSSGPPRRPRCPVPQPPRHRPQGPAGAGRRRTRSRRCRATAGPRMSDLLGCAGQVARSTQPAGNGCPDAWTPDAACQTPGARMPRHCGHPATAAGHGDTAAAATLGSRQQDRPPPGSHVRPSLDHGDAVSQSARKAQNTRRDVVS
jgi:hypothetical protein